MTCPIPMVLACLLALADPTTPIPVNLPKRDKPVSFAGEVAEILDANCVGCHGSALAESKLNMETVAGMLKGGKRGPALVAGKADESLLFRMAAHRVAPVMPPKDKKELKPLTPNELGLLKLWIDSGAKDDTESAPAPKAIEIGSIPAGVHPINAVDMTPDGRTVAAGRANLVTVSDTDSGLDILSIEGHKDLIQSVRFSPDARRLASGSYQVVTVWNAATSRLERQFNGSPEPLKALATPRDGKTVVTGGPERSIRVWTLTDGKTTRTLPIAAEVTCLALDENDRTLAAACVDGSVHLFDFATGKETVTFKGHEGPVFAVASLPRSGRWISAGADGTVRVWQSPPNIGPPAPPVVRRPASKIPIRSLVALPDGKRSVVAGDDATVRVVALDRDEVRSFPSGVGSINALALSPDGATVLVGSADGLARRHQLATGQVVGTFGPHPGGVTDVGFSPTGDRILTGGGRDGVKVWDVANGRGVVALGHPSTKPGGPPPAIHRAQFLKGGQLVTLAADKSARLWAYDGAWTEGKTLGPHVFRVLAIDFSPDGKTIATGGGEPSRSGEVKLWDVETGKLLRSLDNLHSDTVFALRFSPDGSKLATASADKFLKVVEVASGKELKSFEGHTHHVLALDWKADGKQLITGGADNVLKVWDFATGEQLKTLTPAAKQITGLRWVVGKPVVVAASGDPAVRIWNPDNGSVARSLEGVSDYVFAVAASVDGSRIAAGGADGTLLIWNGNNGQLIRKVSHPSGK